MIIIKNGTIIDPANKINSTGDIWIKDGKIEKIVTGSKGKPSKEESSSKVIDAKGAVVAPGFVDIHVHFREPGFEYKEDIQSGSLAAAAGGFSSVACMANTKPVNDNASVTKYIIDKAKSYGITNVFPVACITKGMLGKELSEFGDLKESGAIALSDDGSPVVDSRLFRRALEYAKDFDLPIIDHCEDATLKGNGVMHEGVYSCKLGLEGIPAESESIIVLRDIELLKLTEGKLHLAHISCENSLRAIKEAKSSGLRLTAEVTPHHFTLTDQCVMGYDTNTKVNPPLRTKKDVEALKEAIATGLIDAIASDHAPHAIFEKNVEYDIAPFGMIGLETALSLSLALLEEKLIDMTRLVELLSYNPSKVLGLGRGTLSAGSPADVVIFDPSVSRTVNASMFKSKSHNTPFDGFNLKGEILATITGGKVVYEKGGEKMTGND